MTRPFPTLILSAALLTPALAIAQTAAPVADAHVADAHVADAHVADAHVAVTGAGVPAAAPAPAADAYSKLAPEHAAALHRMLDAIGMPVIMRYYMMHPGPAAVQEQAQLLRHMGSHVSADDITRKQIPVYAKYVSRHAADTIAAYFRSDAGRRQMLAGLAKLGATEGNKNPLFTQAELAQIKRFEASPEAHEMSDATSKINTDMLAVFLQWSNQYYLNLLAESARNVTSQFITAAQRKDGDPAVVITVPRTGLPLLDKMMLAMTDHSIEVERADQQFKNDMKRQTVDHLLSPERLSSKEGIAQSDEALRQIDLATQNYLHTLDQQQESYRQRLIGLSDSKPIIAGFERGLSHAFDWQLRFAENQRGLLDLYKRLLDFAESRQGLITLDNGKLLFKNDDDLQAYRSLNEQIHQYIVQEGQLSIQRQQSMLQVSKPQN